MNDITFNNSQELDDIVVADNLKEIKEHGDLDYPVGVYKIDLNHMRMHTMQWHWHNEIEFIYVQEGHGEFFISEESYILTAGQGILVNQGILHSYHIAPGYDHCVYTAIVFHPNFLFPYGNTKLTATYLQPIVSKQSFPGIPLNENTPFQQSVLNYLEKIIEVNQEKQYGYELYTKEYILHIWILLLERQKKAPKPLTAPRSPKISLDEARAKEAIRFIEENYADPITLDDIADSIHVSKSECCRCIRRCMKMTPFEYLMKYRIYVAAGMLRDEHNDDSIAILALKVGFNSSSYFNKLFRKYMHCTPTQYKNSLLGESD